MTDPTLIPLTGLPAIGTGFADDDVGVIVDVSDATEDVTGTTKSYEESDKRAWYFSTTTLQTAPCILRRDDNTAGLLDHVRFQRGSGVGSYAGLGTYGDGTNGVGSIVWGFDGGERMQLSRAGGLTLTNAGGFVLGMRQTLGQTYKGLVHVRSDGSMDICDDGQASIVAFYQLNGARYGVEFFVPVTVPYDLLLTGNNYGLSDGVVRYLVRNITANRTTLAGSQVAVDSLIGTGTRAVFADANGLLIAP